MSQPEITFRHGLCSASIYENEFNRDGEKLTVRTVSFQRSPIWTKRATGNGQIR